MTEEKCINRIKDLKFIHEMLKYLSLAGLGALVLNHDFTLYNGFICFVPMALTFPVRRAVSRNKRLLRDIAQGDIR